MKEKTTYKNAFWGYVCPVIEGISDTFHTLFYSQECSEMEGIFGQAPRINDYFLRKRWKTKSITSRSNP